MSYFGNQVCKLRKKHGLSQEEFAERIGVSRQIVSKWENGVAIPRITKVKIICDEFDIPPNKLFGTKDSIGKNESHPVAKKGLKLVSKGIATLIFIIFLLYLINCGYKFALFNYLEKRFKEYENWNNYYLEVRTLDEARLTGRTQIWCKDGKYKIIDENYYEDGEKTTNYEWIDCNNNKRAVWNPKSKEIIEINDIDDIRVYKGNKYLRNFFPWITIIEEGKIKLSMQPSLLTIKTNEAKKTIEFNASVIKTDENDILKPISYYYNLNDKIVYKYYNIKQNEVTDKDVEVKKDL